MDKGWLARIERGRYLIVPLEAGPDRVWTEDALVIASYLVHLLPPGGEAEFDEVWDSVSECITRVVAAL